MTVIDNISQESETIESDTFKPIGRKLGYGCWGKVELYEDLGEHRWAIKTFDPNDIALRQMQERGWTEESVMRNEAVPLDAARYNVVPRIIERDKNGKMYVAMPVYGEGTLESRMNEPDTFKSLNIAKEIATALGYVHNNTGSYFSKNPRKAHGDVKPSNIFFDKGHAFLTKKKSTSL